MSKQLNLFDDSVAPNRNVEAVAQRLEVPTDLLRAIIKDSRACYYCSSTLKAPCRSGKPCSRWSRESWGRPMRRHDERCYRPILQPNRDLRLVQDRINERLLWPLVLELDRQLHHGFLRGRSILSNLKRHLEIENDYFLRVDLNDAFGQMNYRRVVALFRYAAGLPVPEARCLARLVTVSPKRLSGYYSYDGKTLYKPDLRTSAVEPHGLPQGAATSPFIYLLIMDHLMRTVIIPNLPGSDFTVTLYADDIVFSSPSTIGPGRVRGVYRAFAKAGLRIKEKKTIRRIRSGGSVSLPGLAIRRWGERSETGLRKVKLDKVRTVLYRASRGRVPWEVAQGYAAWLRFAYGQEWRKALPAIVLRAYDAWMRSPRRSLKNMQLREPTVPPDWHMNESWEDLLLEKPSVKCRPDNADNDSDIPL